MAKDKSKPEESKPEEAKPVEHVPERPREEGEKDTFHEEPKVNRFKNNSEKGIKIKLVDEKKNFKWITVKPGDIVTIPKKIAKANGLVKVQ